MLLPLDAGQARRWADCALAAVGQRFPHKLDHLITSADDRPLPAQIHPVFDGCYDWHSSVHMHWSLLRLLRRVPDLPQSARIVAHFGEHLTVARVGVERAYAAAPGRSSFERPYGWAWLLRLQAELDRPDAGVPQRAGWADALRPFSAEVAQRLAQFLARSHYPVRAGMHANSAFAMTLARGYAIQAGDALLRDAVDAAARRWFGADRAYPADYEPGGADFLSPGLCEALLMRDVLGSAFAAWWHAFAPPAEQLARWFTPAQVSDRSDPQLVHLDGLNLARAWCMEALAASVASDTAARFRAAARAHRDSAWPHLTDGDFAATHWLVSFALLSLGDGTEG